VSWRLLRRCVFAIGSVWDSGAVVLMCVVSLSIAYTGRSWSTLSSRFLYRTFASTSPAPEPLTHPLPTSTCICSLRFRHPFHPQTPEPTHSLLQILHTSPSFYPRFYTLQLLSLLLIHNTHHVQKYLLNSPPPGVEGLLSVLDASLPSSSTNSNLNSNSTQQGGAMQGGAGEMLRNETLLLLPHLTRGNVDLQKIVAFSGAFERLLGIVDMEGGVEGGIVVQDVLGGMGGLLRFNASNQVSIGRSFSLHPSSWEDTSFKTQINSYRPLTELFPGIISYPFTTTNALFPLPTPTYRYARTGRFHTTVLAGTEGRQCRFGIGGH
jgi:hypothetical protein